WTELGFAERSPSRGSPGTLRRSPEMIDASCAAGPAAASSSGRGRRTATGGRPSTVTSTWVSDARRTAEQDVEDGAAAACRAGRRVPGAGRGARSGRAARARPARGASPQGEGAAVAPRTAVACRGVEPPGGGGRGAPADQD